MALAHSHQHGPTQPINTTTQREQCNEELSRHKMEIFPGVVIGHMGKGPHRQGESDPGMVRAGCRSHGPGRTTHAGRRTFICNALSLGIPAQVVMKWTGHSDYKAMKPYIDIADDIKANAMNKFN